MLGRLSSVILGFSQQGTTETFPLPIDLIQRACLPEILSRIFLFLDFPSCSAVSRTCNFWNSLNNSIELWQERERLVSRRCKDLLNWYLLPSDEELQILFSQLPDLTNAFRLCMSS